MQNAMLNASVSAFQPKIKPRTKTGVSLKANSVVQTRFDIFHFSSTDPFLQRPAGPCS